MATLQVLSEDKVISSFPILEPRFLIGRKHDNHVSEIFGGSDKVSRYHAQVDKVGDRFVLTDLGSHNGTSINGVLLKQPAELQQGDLITICHWTFRFCEGESGSCQPSAKESHATRDAHGASSVESRLNVESDGSSATKNTTSAAVRLKALMGVLAALGKTLDLEDLLSGMLAEVLKVFPAADTCLVSLRQPDGSMSDVAVLHRTPGQSTPHLSQTIVADVFRTKQAILYSDRRENPSFLKSDSFREVGMRSAMCVSLLVDDEVIGVMQVDTRQPGKGFRKDDMEVLVSVAPLVNLAIRYSQLHQWTISRRAVEFELAAAQRVQRSFLPSQKPAIPGYEFFAHYNAALEVGGDYYDYVCLPDGRVAVVLANATGKGTSAALFMAAVSGELKCCLLTEKSTATALNKLNRCICDKPENRFVTMALAVLDPAAHAVTILNAGHFAPLLRRVDGKIDEIGAELSGVPLGVKREETYQEITISLAPGESLIMFTDGFTDAENGQGKRYEKQRILDQLGAASPSLSELGRQLVRDAHDFMGSHPQYDDMCLTCFGRQA